MSRLHVDEQLGSMHGFSDEAPQPRGGESMRPTASRIALALLALSLLCSTGVQGQAIPAAHHNPVARLVVGAGHQLKQSFWVEPRKHPYAWGLNMAAQIGMAFADASTSCMLTGSSYEEVGTARFFVGSHPNCRKLVLFEIVDSAISLPAEDWLAHKFTDSCHGAKWDSIPAHTHDQQSCYFAVPTAVSIAKFAFEYPAIKQNVLLIEAK